MTEAYPSDSELLDLPADTETGVEYIPTGAAPYYVQFRKLLYRLLLATRRANDLRVYDEGELLFDKLFFTHNSLDMSNLKDEYVIENETDDAVFSREVHPIFSGGGYCVRCFKEYMDNIGFDLTNLPSSSGLTN